MSNYLLQLGTGVWGGTAALLVGVACLACCRKGRRQRANPDVNGESIWTKLGWPPAGKKVEPPNRPIAERKMPNGDSQDLSANDEAKSPSVPANPPPPRWPVAPAVAENISKDWVDFVAERLDELKPEDHPDETKWALGVVDFLDELSDSVGSATPAEREEGALLRDALVDLLAAKGFVPINSDAWNSDLQRAVSVVRNPGATETRILGKGASGLSRNGKIIRKQEVKIETKGT